MGLFLSSGDDWEQPDDAENALKLVKELEKLPLGAVILRQSDGRWQIVNAWGARADHSLYKCLVTFNHLFKEPENASGG